MRDLALIRRGAAAIILMIALAAPAAAIAPPPEKQKWTRVRMDGYEVFTNLGERKAKEVAESVQRMTDALAKALGAQRRSPVRIFVFAKSSEFRAYRDALLGPGTDKTGVCAPAADVTFIILDGSSPSAIPILNHELTHSLLARRKIAVPLWVDEGLAGFYETLEVRRDRVRIGLPNPGHIGALRSARPLPTREILRVTGATDDFQSGPEARRIYAQAWAMVHLLIVGGDAPPTAIADMLRSIAKGDPLEEAFTSGIGMSLDQFDDALRKYVRQPAFRYLEFQVEREEATQVNAERLEHGRLLAELAELLVRARQLDDARAFIETALAADPRDARAHSARGYHHLERGEFDEARAAFGTARELDPSDEAVGAAVKRLEPRRRYVSGPAPPANPDGKKPSGFEETIRHAMQEATPEERERLSTMLERSRMRADAERRYEEAIALANAQKIDEALQMLEALIGDENVEPALRDAASTIRAEILKQRSRQ